MNIVDEQRVRNHPPRIVLVRLLQELQDYVDDKTRPFLEVSVEKLEKAVASLNLVAIQAAAFRDAAERRGDHASVKEWEMIVSECSETVADVVKSPDASRWPNDN